MIDNASAPTVRGDRDGHRRDVLAAAGAILDEVGWAGFSIRDIAARAGVSSGAVYQWFSGKDEIFGELYNRQMKSGIRLVESVPHDTSLMDAVRLMLDWVVDLHERLGRYQFEFIAENKVDNVPDIPPAMAATYALLGRRTDDLLDRSAAHDGLTLVRNEHRISWFWSSCVGTAERLTSLPHHFVGPHREEMLTFSTSAITRSLIAERSEA